VTDTQTPHDGIGRAYAQHSAAALMHSIARQKRLFDWLVCSFFRLLIVEIGCFTVYSSVCHAPIGEFLPRDASIKRVLCRHAVSVCLSVCVSVTFVDCVKTILHTFKIFSPSGRPTFLAFPYQTAWQYSEGNPPNGGVKCRWGRQKLRF